MAGTVCRHGYSFVCAISFRGINVCFDTPDSYLYRIIHQALPLYQLAFFTPGRLPSSACILKLYCDIIVSPRPSDTFRPPTAHFMLRRTRLTLDILKSRKIPLVFPPRMHRFRICVGLV